MADTDKKKAASKGNKAAPAAGASDAAAAPGETCRHGNCKQPVRAKGYCRKHFLAWRRGDLGTKHRYNTCSKEGCRKKAVAGGRCEEHRKGGGAAEAAA